MTTVSPYPLQWPDNRDRIPANRRVRSPFRTSFPRAVENVQRSLRGFQKDAGVKIEHVVLSTNADLMNDRPSDPGAAVWFTLDGQWVAFAVDRFGDVAANVQAIHHIIEARRPIVPFDGAETSRYVMALVFFVHDNPCIMARITVDISASSLPNGFEPIEASGAEPAWQISALFQFSTVMRPLARTKPS